MIQPFKSHDLVRVSHLQPDGWQDIGPFLHFYVTTPICRAYKIEDKQKIVAIGALIFHVKTAWLAHIIVAPQMRRKGLGVLMTQHLIDAAGEHGRDTQLLIATKMGEPLYEQLGFRRSCEYRFYHSPARNEAELPAAVRQMKPADFPEVLALDRAASGEDRSSLLSTYSNSGLVYTGSCGRRLRGYYLPELSEGLVVAQDDEAGQALMKHRLALADVGPVLPAGNHAANQWLKDMGLAVKNSATRMVRNSADPMKPEMLFNRIGGHLG